MNLKKTAACLASGLFLSAGTSFSRAFAEETTQEAAQTSSSNLLNFGKLFHQIGDNIGFLLIVVLVAAAIVLIAAFLEKKICRAEKSAGKTQKMAVIGMMSALAVILMLVLEFPLPFLAPSFYELDFSEVPVLICAFSMGPMAGVICEFIKILLKLVIRGTSTAFVGEFANFVIGCSLILPAAVVYWKKKTKKTALIGCICGTLLITIVGSLFNALYLLPAFAKLYGMDLSVILEMGHAIYPQVENFSIYHFVFFCVAPLNLIKGVSDSLIVLLIYKPISRILHNHF